MVRNAAYHTLLSEATRKYSLCVHHDYKMTSVCNTTPELDFLSAFTKNII